MSSSGQQNSSTPSGMPASLGPGARPNSTANAENTDSASILKQIAEIRSHYHISLDDSRSNLSIAFELNGRARQFTMPFANLPLPGSAQWLLYGGPARRFTSGAFVIDIVRGAENMANRDLTQPEVEAHAFYASKRMIYSFSAVATSIFVGGAMGYAGRNNMKFPFMKAKPMERYDNFPNRFMPILRGSLARTMWHVTRCNLYTFVSFLLLQPLLSSVGNTAMLVGLHRDPRTAEVMQEYKANKETNRGELNRIGSNIERNPRSQQPRSQQQQQRSPLAQYQDPDPEGYYNDSQDNAPNDYTGGRPYDGPYSGSGDSAYTDSTNDSGILSDAQMRTQESQKSSPSNYQRRPQPPQQAKRQRSSDSDFFFDDASPTAGNDPDMSTGAQASYNPDSGGGSAWERVRRTGPPPSSADSALGNRRMISGVQREQSQSSRDLQRRDASGSSESSADSFSFSKGDEERQLAKEQAQRDFDRMVDAERNGSAAEEFTEGSGIGGSAWEGRRNK